jgi:hypothetical protein
MWFTLTVLQAASMLFCAWVFGMALVAGNLVPDIVAEAGIAVSLALAAAAPFSAMIWSLLHVRRYNKRHLGWRFCSTCRYDLTGNVSGICPECGTEIVR